MRQWTFGQKIAAGYVLPLVMLLVLGGVSFRITTIMVDNARWVTHTHEVLERLASLMAEVTTAESAQRGFVLSGDAAQLEIYDAAANHVPALIKEVRQLTADNQPQQRRLDQAEPVFKAKLDFMSSTIAARRDQGFDEAMKRVSGGEGRRVMVELRKLIDAMEDEERRLLVERDAAARASVDAARLLIWGTCAAAFALVTLAGWLITRSLNAQLRNAVADIQTSSAELQSNAAETAAGSTEQKAAITEASTTLKELAATSRQMAESAQRVTRIAEDTAGSTRNGDLTVAKAQEAINGIRRQVDLIVTHMLDLGRKSQQVGLVLELINELAEQTNILAVNATIESAGAGEAGKRFGVVADEIRKLADRVGASTKEIRLLIDEIRSAANTTVMATEDGSKAVDAGSRTFGEVTSVFRQIAAGIQTTTEASREIELGARQQVTAVDQVGIALTGILQAATQAEISTRQTQETSSLLATLSKKLLLLVQADRRH